MSEEASPSPVNTKKFYVYLVIGLLIFSIFAVFSYAADEKIDSGDLTLEELNKQRVIYLVSKIGSMIGFIIALIPSVRILQHGILKLNEKND